MGEYARGQVRTRYGIVNDDQSKERYVRLIMRGRGGTVADDCIQVAQRAQMDVGD